MASTFDTLQSLLLSAKALDNQLSALSRKASASKEAWGRMPTMDRASYLSRDARGLPGTTVPNTDIEYWLTPRSSGSSEIWTLTLFAGKANKPLVHTMYRTEEQAMAEVRQWATIRSQRAEAKALKSQERKDYVPDISVGDVYVSSWGYDQTNVNWYQITAVSSTGKSVIVRQIESDVVSSGQGTDMVMPVKNNFTRHAPIKCIPQKGYKGEPSLRISTSQTARKWDGKPQHATSWGYGH